MAKNYVGKREFERIKKYLENNSGVSFIPPPKKTVKKKKKV
jgi:hypothetical protein